LKGGLHYVVLVFDSSGFITVIEQRPCFLRSLTTSVLNTSGGKSFMNSIISGEAWIIHLLPSFNFQVILAEAELAELAELVELAEER